MHILLIRFSSLGDVVIQTSFASWIKSQFTEVHLSFLTSKEFTPLITGHPHIDEVVPYERTRGVKDLKKLRATIRDIHRQRPVDFIIDLHGTTRSFFIKLLNPDIPCLNLDKRRWERWLLVKLKIDLLKKEKTLHERVIDDYQAFFNKKYHRWQLETFLTEANGTHGTLTSAPESFQDINFKKPFEKYIVLAPVASFAPKRWPIDRFMELAKEILKDKDLANFGLVLVAGPKDDYVDLFHSLEEQYPERLLNLKGKTSLDESSRVIRYSSLVVGNDTGMGHIAESYGVRVISIFGPTSESFGFRPHIQESESLSVDLWCRPCSTTGKKKCFRSQQFCMENVTIEMVLQKIKRHLEA